MLRESGRTSDFNIEKRFVNYVVIKLSKNGYEDLTCDERFALVEHVGISGRLNNLLDRMKENARNYSTQTHGMITLLVWDLNEAKKYGFDSAGNFSKRPNTQDIQRKFPQLEVTYKFSK